ncbi:MAG TPA: hypothetical protein PKW42_00830 [bacterium]|nr:hypothetical protein [bacterium]
MLKIYPEKGIPALCFPFCRWLSGADMMNAEGVAEDYSQVVIDRHGLMFSAEIACPLVQLRLPGKDNPGMNCVNCFQLPWLKEMTNRTPAQMENAERRKDWIERMTREGNRSVQHMKRMLRHLGEFSLCRHGGKDASYTEYSIIGIPAERKAFFAEGNPCQVHYQTVAL